MELQTYYRHWGEVAELYVLLCSRRRPGDILTVPFWRGWSWRTREGRELNSITGRRDYWRSIYVLSAAFQLKKLFFVFIFMFLCCLHPQNEAMTGSHTQNRVFSRLTLAIMEDSGWYRANYSLAQRLDWGRGLGCDFVMKSCKFWMDRQRQRSD